MASVLLSAYGDVVAGLHEVHDVGVCHQDVHSGNVFVRFEAGLVRAKLGDYGESNISGDKAGRHFDFDLAKRCFIGLVAQVKGVVGTSSSAADAWADSVTNALTDYTDKAAFIRRRCSQCSAQ